MQATDTSTEYKLSTWASTVRIRVFDLPVTMDELKRQSSSEGRNRTASGIVAYVRHNHTNYKNLMTYLRNCNLPSGWDAYFVVRKRTSERIQEALEKKYGDEWLKHKR